MIEWVFYYSTGNAEVAWSFTYNKNSKVRFEMLKWQYQKHKETLKEDYGITWKPHRVEKRRYF